MRYSITTVTPAGYPHVLAFSDVSHSLFCALKTLGKNVVRRTEYWNPQYKHILFGAHLLKEGDVLLPGTAIYNLEQLGQNEADWMPLLWKIMRLPGVEVWDYSKVNLEVLRKAGIEGKLLPIGYVPELSDIKNRKEEEKDVDVAFFGSVNSRREKILRDLGDKGYKVLGGSAYGAARADVYARAKLVLNLNFYEKSRIFNIVRCSYLMANKCCIVSENSCETEGLESGICFTPYENLVATCERLLKAPERRAEFAERGFELIQKRDLAKYLSEVI